MESFFAKIESNENDEILRRKKAIEASKAEEKVTGAETD